MDPEIFAIVQKEQKRQRESLELIASENFTSTAVMQMVCLCACQLLLFQISAWIVSNEQVR